MDGRHLASDSRPGLGRNDTISGAAGLDYDDAVVRTDGDFESVDGRQVESNRVRHGRS